jgi:hypothetical protein
MPTETTQELFERFLAQAEDYTAPPGVAADRDSS